MNDRDARPAQREPDRGEQGHIDREPHDGAHRDATGRSQARPGASQRSRQARTTTPRGGRPPNAQRATGSARPSRPPNPNRPSVTERAGRPSRTGPSSRTARPTNPERPSSAARASAPPARGGIAARAASIVSTASPRTLAIAGAVVVLLLVMLVAFALCSQRGGQAAEQDAPGSAAPAWPEGTTVVSFTAVGDNLPDEYIGYVADKKAGAEGDGTYDYSFLFENIAPYSQSADLAYINQETHIGGNDIEPQGYPSFNTTDEMADAVVNAGFDFVASATNHSYDWGSEALEHSLSVWERQPVAFTGTATSAEQADRIVTQERNGITFALLDYTYGVNGYEESELPPYAVNFIHEERIRADVARARETADVVLVAMHWGTENLMEADDNQKKYAQLLADLDVDVVLGSHPHVIGPMEWVANSNGNGHETLVAYSLGNFVADHETPHDKNVLEGMLSCDFVRLPDSSDISVENVKWTPLVFHSNDERDEFALYTVDDYPDDRARANRALADKPDPKEWLRTTTEDVVGHQWFGDES